MHNFCVVCFLTVSFCLVVCVSANVEVKKEDAEAAVRDAKASVTTVRARAQTQLDNATSLLGKVDSSKNKAAHAYSQAEKVATGNTEATKIAQTIKSLSDEVVKFYSDEKQKLATAVGSLTQLLSDANGLDDASNIQVTPNADKGNDFTDTKNTATGLTTQATDLDGRITGAFKPIDDLYSTANDMEKKAKEAEVKNFHVSVIVAVAQIKTTAGEAHSIMQTIPTKKNEVNDILQEIQRFKDTATSGSTDSIDAMYKRAEAELTKATSALKKTKTANEAIKQQKGLAETALTNIEKIETDVTKAQKEAEKAKTCSTTVEQHVLQVKSEVHIAETSLTNAKDLKKQMETTLSKARGAQNTPQSNEKEKGNLSVGDGTESHQKDTTVQPTSKELPDQSNKSADKLKNTLSTSAQNVPTTALTGRKAPAPGANNDSTMTVSVPLLVALIASAVLQ